MNSFPKAAGVGWGGAVEHFDIINYERLDLNTALFHSMKANGDQRAVQLQN